MGKQKYNLYEGEHVVLKVTGVSRGFWGLNSNALTITNKGVIFEKYGMLDNFKGIERFDYSDITQAIQGVASNGNKQLELYINGQVECFVLESDDENEIKVLILAINDQMGSDADKYDLNYYTKLLEDAKESDRIIELRAKAEAEGLANDPASLLGTAAKNILKSGDLSIKGVAKGVAKATGKSIFGGVSEKFLEEIGVREIQDEFTEVGNEFREEFGLKTKMTHAEKKELEELETKRKKQEIVQNNPELQNRLNSQNATLKEQGITESPKKVSNENSAKMSVKEQMELLQQMKNLLDMGVLTQEEFDRKKKEILNN